jgi:bifunctional non-homologous end joining protein LigD
MTEQDSITLYFREGSADKVYQCGIEAAGERFVVNFAYGRRGSTLNTGTKTNVPVDHQDARRIFDKLVKEKTTKGYTPGENGTPYQHTNVGQRASGLLPQLLNAIDEAEVEGLVADDHWAMQEKFDGRRMLVQKQGAAIHGINRKGLMVGLPSPVTVAAHAIPGDFIVDGECVGDALVAFDLLERDGDDHRPLGYRQRLTALLNLLASAQQRHIHFIATAYEVNAKVSLLKQLRFQNKEGVVFKRLDAPYTPGRPNSGGPQLKHKFYATLSAVVGKQNAQRSVELKLRDGRQWVAAGNVTIPVNHRVPGVGAVVEIRYLYAFRESGCLYQPTYLGPRSDVNERECTAAQLKYKSGGEEDES